MFRLATVNVNGVRAAVRKGMVEWFEQAACDVVTLQEVRAPDAIAREVLSPLSGHVAHAESVDKGRAGVAVVSSPTLTAVRADVGDPTFADAGRWIEVDVETTSDRPLTIVSAYVHSGEAGTPKQDLKYQFIEAAWTRLASLHEAGHHVVLTGDLNIAHTARDIRNAQGNRTKAGFLPEERALLDRLVELGFVDVHRRLAGDVDGPYTWWSMRGQAFDNDTGWRIDYQFASPDLAATARAARVDRAPTWGERWSDHAPLVIDYDLDRLSSR